MEIDAVVLAIDAERERISLGIKQIGPLGPAVSW
jgi:ribosomal protein S1